MKRSLNINTQKFDESIKSWPIDQAIHEISSVFNMKLENSSEKYLKYIENFIKEWKDEDVVKLTKYYFSHYVSWWRYGVCLMEKLLQLWLADVLKRLWQSCQLYYEPSFIDPFCRIMKCEPTPQKMFESLFKVVTVWHID